MPADRSLHPRLTARLVSTDAAPSFWACLQRWSLISQPDRNHLLIVSLIVLLSVIIYFPFLTLPLLPDDYLQIMLARKYGPVSGWSALADDSLYRSRATSLIVTYWTEHVFGSSSLVMAISSLLLHVVNALLVYGLGIARRIGWRPSALVAVFFVLQERYHEAVIWYAALPELLAFCFSLATLLCWIRWLHAPSAAPLAWMGALICFCLALLSKESAVAVILLMLLFIGGAGRPWRRALSALLPFGLLGIAYVGLVFSGQERNHHFQDGTFALQTAALKVLLGSAIRALWIWGIVGLIVLLVLAYRRWCGVLTLALGWILIALLPYSFLTYMPRIPSRHHYLAAVGCALILAAAALALQERIGKQWIAGLCALLIGVHHTSYLWAVKYPQFQKRSEPVEVLLRFMQHEARRPVVLRCFPHSFDEARRAVMLRLGEPEESLLPATTTNHADLPSFCLKDQLTPDAPESERHRAQAPSVHLRR